MGTENTEISNADSAEEEEPVSAPNPRDAALEEAAQRRNAEINSELEEAGSNQRIDIIDPVDDTVAEDVVSEPEPEPETKDDVTPEPEPGTEPEPEPAVGRMVSVEMEDGTVVQVPATSIRAPVKVDGEDSEVTLDTMTKGYQMATTADIRLKEAAKRTKDVTAREQAVTLREQTQPSDQDVVDPAPSDQDVQTQADDIVDALFNGDVDKAKDAIKGALTQRDSSPVPAVSADALADDVEERLDARKAGRTFAKEFSDITSDPFLMSRADAFADEIALEDPGMSKEDIFVEAGTRTRTWVKRQAGVEDVSPEPTPEPSPTPTSTTMETRRERKARAVQKVPTSKKVAGLGEQDKPQASNSDVIAEMKKARGQAI